MFLIIAMIKISIAVAKKDPNINDKEFYDFVFDKQVTDAEIKEYLGSLPFE